MSTGGMPLSERHVIAAPGSTRRRVLYCVMAERRKREALHLRLADGTIGGSIVAERGKYLWASSR